MHYLSLSARVIKQALPETLAMVIAETEPNVSLTVQVSGRCLCGKPCHSGDGLPHMSPIALHRRPIKKAARRCLLQALVTNAKQARTPEYRTRHIPNPNVPPRNPCTALAPLGEGHPTRQTPKAFQEQKSSGAASYQLLCWGMPGMPARNTPKSVGQDPQSNYVTCQTSLVESCL